MKASIESGWCSLHRDTLRQLLSLLDTSFSLLTSSALSSQMWFKKLYIDWMIRQIVYASHDTDSWVYSRLQEASICKEAVQADSDGDVQAMEPLSIECHRGGKKSCHCWIWYKIKPCIKFLVFELSGCLYIWSKRIRNFATEIGWARWCIECSKFSMCGQPCHAYIQAVMIAGAANLWMNRNEIHQ